MSWAKIFRTARFAAVAVACAVLALASANGAHAQILRNSPGASGRDIPGRAAPLAPRHVRPWAKLHLPGVLDGPRPGKDDATHPRRCPRGWSGVPPKCCPAGKLYRRGKCVGQGNSGRDCPTGTVGKFPDCTPIERPKCPSGWTGRSPVCCAPGSRYLRGECVKPNTPRSCPPGTRGKPPICVSIRILEPERERTPPVVIDTPPTVRPQHRQPPRFVAPPAAAVVPLAQQRQTNAPPPAAVPLFRAGELVVMVRGADPDAVANGIARSFNLNLRETISLRLLPDARVYRLGIPDNRSVEGLAAAVARTPGVSLSGPNFYSVLQGDAPPPAPDVPKPRSEAPPASPAPQYALPKLHVPAAQGLARGRGVIIAVIDSAVDANHPALRGADVTLADAFTDSIPLPHNHGTAITGIIAARGDMTGVAPDAKIIGVRAFAPELPDTPPVTTSTTLARAVDLGFEQGARVFNMSFAGPRDPLLIAMIDAADARGAIFVAAAGNNGPDAPPAFPAAYEKVIAITATDEGDQLYAHANRGDYVTVAAPGVDILVPVAAEGFDYMSGTSFAAAHVSGIIALLMERHPGLTAADARRAMVDAARDLGDKGRDQNFGAGLANAYETLAGTGAEERAPK